jgi:hypothetical protein
MYVLGVFRDPLYELVYHLCVRVLGVLLMYFGSCSIFWQSWNRSSARSACAKQYACIVGIMP